MGTLSGAGFSKVALISEPYKIKMEHGKKLNILFNISYINDFTDSDEFAFYA